MVPKKEARPGGGRALKPDQRSDTTHTHNNLFIDVNQEVRNYFLMRLIKSCIAWLFYRDLISFRTACRAARFFGVCHV
jgi:hypothetical protein